MFRIFAALRMIVAKFGQSLGSFAVAAIEDDYIPQLKAKQAKAKDEAKSQKLQEQIDEWIRFSKGDKRDTWEGIARNTIINTVRKFGLNYDIVEDIEQNVSMMMLEDAEAKGIFSKFNIDHGPEFLAKRWKAVLRNLVFNAVRAYKNATLEHKFGKPADDIRDEGATPAIERMVAPRTFTEIDAGVMKEVKTDLDRYIATHYAHDVALILLYKKWMDLAERRGPENVSFSRDIEPDVVKELKKKGLPHSHGTVATMTLERMTAAIVKFFEEELDHPISERMKKRLVMAERVAYSEFRRRLAAWVLGQ